MAPHEIVLLLELVRQAHREKRLTRRRDRDKNMATLASLGCTVREMYEAVASVQPEDALGPPWKNTNPGFPDEQVCEFGTVLQGHDVYVKIAVVGLEDGVRGCVISFHFPEKPLAYPYR